MEGIFTDFACGHFPASLKEFNSMLASDSYTKYVAEQKLQQQLREHKAKQERMKKQFETVVQQFSTVESQLEEAARRSDSTERKYASMFSAVQDYLGACLCAIPHLKDKDLTRLTARFLINTGH